MLEINKIYEGDCLEVMKEIDDNSIDMILCDLPYGTTACKWDIIISFDKLWEQYERIIKPNGAIILTASQPFTSVLILSNPKLFRYELIYEKTLASNFVHAKYQPLKCHENILIFSKSGAAQGTKSPMKYFPIHEVGIPYNKGVSNKKREGLANGMNGAVLINGNGDRKPRSVIKFSNADRRNILHPTQKPVALFEYLIKTYTNEGDVILDNCIGSGTTAIAALKTGRKFIGIEKEKKYVDIANNRIEEYLNDIGDKDLSFLR